MGGETRETGVKRRFGFWLTRDWVALEIVTVTFRVLNWSPNCDTDERCCHALPFSSNVARDGPLDIS